MAYDISVFTCIWCLDYVRVIFGASLRALKHDMTHKTSYRNVISIEHTASSVFVAFWLALPFEEKKNLIVLCLQIFNTPNIHSFQNLGLVSSLKMLLKFRKFQPQYSYKIHFDY